MSRGHKVLATFFKNRETWNNIAKQHAAQQPTQAQRKNYDDATDSVKKKTVKEAADKEHPIYKEYQSLKKHDIKTLRGIIKQQHRIIDTSEFRTKEHAISHILNNKHGNKRVMAALGESLEQIDETSNCRTPVEKNYYKAYRHLHFCKGVKGKSSSSKGGPASDAGADAGNGGGNGGGNGA